MSCTNNSRYINIDQVSKSSLNSIQQVLAQKLNKNYRISQSRWAGGNNNYLINFTDLESEISAIGASEKVWSSNGKWSGSDAKFSIIAHKNVIENDLICTAGVVHIFAEKIGAREFRVIWLEQGRGFDLKKVEGFLIKGIHCKGKNLKDAQRKVAKIRAEQLFKIKNNKELKSDSDKLKRVWVSIADSLKCGNCEVGTKAFIKAKELGKLGALRADYLLELSDQGFRQYAERAIRQAATRYF